MSEKNGLLDQRIKIVLRRFHPDTPRDVIRGIITEVDESGVRVSGRRFQEFAESAGSVPEERPAEKSNKIYWIPFNSIRYSEIIPPGSISERLDAEVQRRKPLRPEEIYRKSSLE